MQSRTAARKLWKIRRALAQPAGQYPRIYLYGGFFAVCCIRRGRQGTGETQRPVCPHPAPQHHVHGERTGYRDPVVGRTVHTRHVAAKLERKDTCIPCRTFPMERCTVQGPENRRRFPRIRCAERRKDKLHPYQKPCRRTVYPTHRYGKSGCKGRQCYIDPAKEGEYLLDLKKGESVILTAAGGIFPS